MTLMRMLLKYNKIDGSTFLELDSEDMKELGITALGDRKKLERLMKNGATESIASTSTSRVAGVNTS